MVAAPSDRQGRDTAWHSPEGRGGHTTSLPNRTEPEPVRALGRRVERPGVMAHLCQGSAAPSGQMRE